MLTFYFVVRGLCLVCDFVYKKALHGAPMFFVSWSNGCKKNHEEFTGE
jgi:hypothetical protein